MAGDFSTGKTVLVLAIVVGCFAVLWPRVLYPILISAPPPPPSTSKEDPASRRGAPPRPLPHDMLHPALRDRAHAYTQRGGAGARGGAHPGLRPPMAGGGHLPPPTAPHKGNNSMSVIMPLYTVGIIIFFLYTIMKVLTKKPCEAPSFPRVKDFHMDPEQRKFVFAEEYVDRGAPSRRGGEAKRDSTERGRRGATPKPGDSKVTEPRIEDEQMEALRLRLEHTEKAMERLMAQMGSVSEKLSSASINEVLSQTQQESFQAEQSRGSSKASSVDIEEYELVNRDSSRENSVPVKDDLINKASETGNSSTSCEVEEIANDAASLKEDVELTQVTSEDEQNTSTKETVPETDKHAEQDKAEGSFGSVQVDATVEKLDILPEAEDTQHVSESEGTLNPSESVAQMQDEEGEGLQPGIFDGEGDTSPKASCEYELEEGASPQAGCESELEEATSSEVGCEGDLSVKTSSQPASQELSAEAPRPSGSQCPPQEDELSKDTE